MTSPLPVFQRQALRVPLPLPQFNDVIRSSKAHWGAYYSLKDRHTKQVAWLARAARLQPMQAPLSVLCEWHPASRRVDPDNLSHALKYVLDGLMMAGVLPGDGYSVLRVIEHAFSEPDKDTPHVLVVLQTFGDHQ